VAGLHEACRFEPGERLADGEPRDPELRCEVLRRGQSRSGWMDALEDQLAKLEGNAVGESGAVKDG